jgi:hypothetical protein
VPTLDVSELTFYVQSSFPPCVLHVSHDLFSMLCPKKNHHTKLEDSSLKELVLSHLKISYDRYVGAVGDAESECTEICRSPVACVYTNYQENQSISTTKTSV